jgi:hypothetical protein
VGEVTAVDVERIPGSEGRDTFRLAVAYKFSVGNDGPYTGESFWQPLFFSKKRVLGARHNVHVHQQVLVHYRQDDPSVSKLDRRVWQNFSAADRTISRMVYEIDGTRFSTLEEFLAEFSRVVIPEHSPPLSHSLDAFNDVLRGGFGTPDAGFTIRWKNHKVSRQRLGPTVFDSVVEIIRHHGPGGWEAEDRVELVLD